MKVTVLLFHRVRPQRDPLWDPIDPVLFEQVLKYVSKNYSVVGLDEFFNSRDKKYTRPPLIITYDDGYRDFIDYSFPLLKKYSLPSSMFVVTDCIDNDLPTWTYMVDLLFYNTRKTEIRANFELPDSRFNKNKWVNNEERIAYGSKFKQYLKNVPEEKRKEILRQLTHSFDDVSLPNNLMMNWEEIRQLQAEGVQFGSHTVTHPSLATVTNETELRNELLLSAGKIKEKTGKFPSTISYPVGSYNEKVKKAAKEAGYKIGLVVDHDIYDTDKQDMFQIPRIELYNESFLKTKLRISGNYSKLKRLLGR